MQVDTPDDSPFAIPEWVREHPLLKLRGIELEIVYKPHVVWHSPFEPTDVPHYVVKIVKPSSEEVEIYARLQRHSLASPNHTIPCEVIRTDAQRPLLLMPSVSHYSDQFFPEWTITETLNHFHQIAEGLEFLHDRRIAHLDLRFDNLLLARRRDVKFHKEIELGKVYIIDFSKSRQLQLGPGHQLPIDLPRSIIPKPLEMQRLDPYSFDVYCLGRVLDSTLELVYRPRPPPWILECFAQWLIGDERGCTGVCQCRPTARRARQVLVVLQWTVRGMTMLKGVLYTISRVFSPLQCVKNISHSLSLKRSLSHTHPIPHGVEDPQHAYWLQRAVHLADLATAYQKLTQEGKMKTPDHPYSLYEGVAGMCCAWAEVLVRLRDGPGTPGGNGSGNGSGSSSGSGNGGGGVQRRGGMPGYDDLALSA